MDRPAPGRAHAIGHEVFEEQIKAVLVSAGLPIAATWDPSLSSGVGVEVVDDTPQPSAVLEWRVHPTLVAHFLNLRHDQLLNDPRVRAMRNAQQAMNTAVTTILEFAGYRVREARGERAGALIVSRAERATAQPLGSTDAER